MRSQRYDIHAVLAVHAEKLRARQEAAAAELAAEREAAAEYLSRQEQHRRRVMAERRRRFLERIDRGEIEG